MPSRYPVILAPLTVGLALAGCGGSTTSSSTSSPSSAAATTAPTTARTAAAAAGSRAMSVVLVTKHGKLGSVAAVGAKRMTVYLFAADRSGTSRCSAACAAVWPPLLGHPRAGAGVSAAALGTITRRDGTVQVTLGGHPLYRYVKDGDAGDAYGQGIRSFGADWYALRGSGQKIDPS